jgi:zinc protease
LSREVRGKRGWSYGASSDLPIDLRRQGFSLWTFPQAADAAACVELELKLLREFIASGVSKAELSRAKKYLVNSNVFAGDTASKRASSALDRIIYDLGADYHSGFIDRVRSVTVLDVNAAVTRRLSSDNLEITVLGTHAAIGAEMRRAVGEVQSDELFSFDATD